MFPLSQVTFELVTSLTPTLLLGEAQEPQDLAHRQRPNSTQPPLTCRSPRCIRHRAGARSPALPLSPGASHHMRRNPLHVPSCRRPNASLPKLNIHSALLNEPVTECEA